MKQNKKHSLYNYGFIAWPSNACSECQFTFVLPCPSKNSLSNMEHNWPPEISLERQQDQK